MIINFKKTEYRDCPLYFRRVGIDIWEYFTIIENELYTAHYILKPKWWKRHFKEPFNKKEMKACLYVIIKAAETTIDVVLKEKKINDKGNKNRK